MDEDWITTAFTAVITLVLFVVLIFGGRAFKHHQDEHNCPIFGQQTSRETRFVDYSFFRWDCLTRTQTGQWIPTDKIREF